ncbi:MAG: hypothetical protein IJB70_10995 [Clostridia bacterium]|nr:hypothetical protein [Clostridia bacterium]
MKNSKKIVSLLICIAMLITMIPTVFAEGSAISVTAKDEAADLTLFNETFGASGSVNEKVTAAYASNYRTKTEFSYVEKETGDYALEVTSSTHTGTSGNNYGEVRNALASGVEMDVSSGQYSISYDICINSFTTASETSQIFTKISASTTPGVTSGTSNINRTVLTVSTADNNAALVFGTGTRLEIGKWYNIKHYFDVVSGIEYMTVTDENGNSDVSTYDAYDVVGVKRFAISFCIPANVYLDNITLKNEGVVISDFAETVDVKEDVSFTATLPEGFDSALVYADGELLSNITPVSGKNSYNITLPTGTLPVGNREIIVSASYPDGTVISNKVDFAVIAEYIAPLTKDNGTAVTTDVVTFDSLYNSATTAEDGTINIKYTPIMTSGWQCDADGYLIPGPSGEEGDYALKAPGGKVLQVAGVTGTIKVNDVSQTVHYATEGITVMEFDLQVQSDVTDLRFYPISSDSQSFMNDNKILETVDVKAGEWIHIKVVSDLDNKTTDVTVGDTVIHRTSAVKTNTNIRMQSTNGTTFAMDNAVVYNILPGTSITSAAYDSTVITNKTVPASAKTLSLTLSDATLVPTLDDVELYVDGASIAPAGVSTVDGVVTITLPALTAHTDLDVIIKDTVDGIGNNITETFYVTDANGYFFKSAGVAKSGDKIIGGIRHLGNCDFSTILAAYNSNELSAVHSADYKHDTSPHDSNSAKIIKHAVYPTVVTPDVADSAKVMAWDTLKSATPKVTAPLYNLD